MSKKITVYTHSGFKADEYPLRFEVDGTRLEVIAVEDRWYDPSYEAFKVFADDGATYILRNRKKDGFWDMERVR